MQIIDTFQNRLKKAMNIRNLKQVDLVNKTGIDKTLINKYLAGIMKAKQDKLTILANALNINEVWLMGYDVPMEKNFSIKKDLKLYGGDKNYNQLFPILGLVKAGYDYFAEENCIGYISLDKDVSDIENYFALKVAGDSMQPILYENDYVVVHKQDDVDNGQVAIILINGDEATIKKVIKYNDHIELQAFNPYYPKKILSKNDDFKIIGKVVEARISKVFE